MMFSTSKFEPKKCPDILSLQGTKIECVMCYKYLGIVLDSQLSFKVHIDKLISKLKLKLGFYYRNRTLFSFNARKYLVSATFLPLLDYGDILYMNAPTHYLKKLDIVFHSALRFITGCSYQTHHCILYEKAELPSLHTRRGFNWYCFIYKSICSLNPHYLSLNFSNSNGRYKLRSNDLMHLKVPRVRTPIGKKGFTYNAASSWN